MSLVIPQGKNSRRFKKTKLGIRKKAILKYDPDVPEDLVEDLLFDGKTSYYFMSDEDYLYVDTKPFTLEEAKEE